MNITAINSINNYKNINFSSKTNATSITYTRIYESNGDSFNKTRTQKNYFSNGDIESEITENNDGSVEIIEYYKGRKGIKSKSKELPTGYTTITKYYPKTGTIKEKTVISAGKFCQETIEYNKDGSPKKAYRQWSNGVHTKLPKDFELIG